MLYSVYYPAKVNPTAKPTTQADQMNALLKVNDQSNKVDETDSKVDKVSKRIEQLKAQHTVAELRAMAKELGLTVGGRAKEEAIATQIATHELGGSDDDREHEHR